MKITEQILKEMIEDVMQEVDLDGDEDPDRSDADAEAIAEPSELDVTTIARLMNKIDQPAEYIELLTMVLKYGSKIQGRENILRRLQSQLSSFIGEV